MKYQQSKNRRLSPNILQHPIDKINMTMKKLSFLLGFLFLTTLGMAQSYFTAGGIRIGDGIGISLQQRVAKKVTVEGILKNNNARDEFSVTGLIERHISLISRRLNFYTGIGLHKGFVHNDELETKGPFGITAVGGLEFTIGKLNLSYDFKPALNLSGGTKVFYPDTALSLRYVIVGNKVLKNMKKNKKKKQRQKARDKRKKNGGGIFN
jgi:hypothetical protein